MTNILIVGDAHAKPGTDLSRFTWLSKYVIDTKPDVIIDMGDWEDMPSLCSYDKGTKSYEGRRYKEDIKAARKAREMFNAPLSDYNDHARSIKKRQYQPSLLALGCNHFEKRVRRAIEYSPELEGLISENDHGCEEFGWERIPFLEPVTVAGFTFSHYFQGNGTANPLAMGKHPASVLLREKHTSCVMGHNHLLDFATDLNGRDERLWGISAGCFFDHWEVYAGRNNKRWWRGVITLKGASHGDVRGIETITIETLKEKYGN